MVSRFVAFLSLATLIIGVLVGQGAATAAGGIPVGSWQVVLAAGDDAEPVFDNATRELSQRLAAAGVPAGNIHRLSANAAELSHGVEPALAKVLLRRIAELQVRAGDRCTRSSRCPSSTRRRARRSPGPPRRPIGWFAGRARGEETRRWAPTPRW